MLFQIPVEASHSSGVNHDCTVKEGRTSHSTFNGSATLLPTSNSAGDLIQLSECVDCNVNSRTGKCRFLI